MMNKRWAVLGIVFTTVGCSSDDSGGAKKSTLPLDGMIHSWVIDQDKKSVPGVEICVEAAPDIPCVTTDANGIGDLPVPKNQALVVTYSKLDFITKRRQLFSDEYRSGGLGVWVLQTKTWYTQLAQALLAPQDFDYTDKGLVGLSVGTGPAEEFILNTDHSGTTFDLSPIAGAKDPGIVEEKFQVAGDLTVVGCVAGCTDGVVGYADVPPGRYRAVFNTPNKTCTVKAFACADATPACVELEVVAGTNTYATMSCE
ncbi:MAG: hypothetical protein IPI67_18425 [Myxococcales bacterium]|nr:hypothetical protein [Myxococcales bacterium]